VSAYRSTSRQHWQAAERASAGIRVAHTKPQAERLAERLAQLRQQAATG
jgi:hypothetical protein